METKQLNNCVCDIPLITNQTGICSRCNGKIQTKLSKDGKTMILSIEDWQLFRNS